MSTPRICFVVAVAENGVIGRDNQLPWRLPTDLKRFRALTLGKPVIMGRRTYESIGKPLGGRDNIVLARRPDYRPAGTHIAHSMAEAIELGRRFATERGVDEIMVIGGAEVFAAALPCTDRIYLTLVHATPPGDTYFHVPATNSWSKTASEPMPRASADQFAADFLVLDRKPGCGARPA